MPTRAQLALSGKRIPATKPKSKPNPKQEPKVSCRTLTKPKFQARGRQYQKKTPETAKCPNLLGKVGRPRKLDDKAFEQLTEYARHGATIDEIASRLGVAPPTLYEYGEQFINAYKAGYCEGNISLRRAQMLTALAGNATMLIWLGKQRLGQRDVVTTELTGPDGTPIQMRSIQATLDLNQLSVKELELLRRLIGKAQPTGEGEIV